MKIRALTLCAVVLAACQPPTQPPEQPAATKAQFDNFAISVTSSLNSLAAKIAKVEDEQLSESWRRRNSRVAQLDPTAKGYTILETDVGRLLVADTEATPYLDGFSVRFKVGNPHAASIGSSTIVARWGPPLDFGGTNLTAAIATYDKAQRTNQFEISEPLLSGAWTPLEIKITPADAASIKQLSIELNPKALHLRILK